MQLSLTLDVHTEGDSVWGEVLELPGCFAEGKDLSELKEAVLEAVTFYLEELSPEELKALLIEDDPTDEPVASVLSFGPRPAPRMPVTATIDQMRMRVEA